jgi:hypothetical protein
MLPAYLGSSRIGHPRPRPLLFEPLEPRCLLDGLGLLPPGYGWTQTLGASGFDTAVAIQQDTAGDLIIAGFFEGTVDFDPSPDHTQWRTSQGSRDIFVTKLSAAGQHLWTWTAGGLQADQPHGLCLSPLGEVLVTGEYRLTADFDSRGSGDERTAAGGSDVFVTKLGADGQYLWTRTFGGTSFESGQGIAVDSQGRVIAVGNFRGTVDFDLAGQGDSRTSRGQSDVFLTRLAADGSYLGTLQYGGTSIDLAADVSVDAQDKIALAGMFMGSVDFDPTVGQDVHESAGYYDVFVTRITAAGAYGGTTIFGGTKDQEVTALVHDADGNIYVTGGYEGTVVFGDQDSLTSQGGFDIFVARLDADGSYGWIRGMGGPSSEFGRGLAIAPPDELFVVGSFAGSADFDLQGSGDVRTASGGDDVFVTRLGRDGAYRGVWTVGGTGTDIAYDVVADEAVTMVGFFQNSVDFDHTEETDLRFSLGSADTFVSRILEPGEAGGELGSRVWYDANADGRWQADESGLPDVPVRLYQSDSAGGGLTLVSSTVSDVDGFYLFSAVSPGDYVIEFETPAGYAPTLYRWGVDRMWDSDASWTDGRTEIITLAAGESQLDWDAGYLLDTVAVIGGRTWDDANGNGLQDAGEGNVAAVDVTLMLDDFTTVGITATAADGRYAFTGMNPGTYSMRWTPPGGYSFTKQDVGDDDTLDSDVDSSTRRIESVDVVAGTRDLSWDAGILRYDFGDAPDPTYSTLRASDGAVHRIVPGIYLGTGIDGDADGQPDSRALGDDLGDGSDDEDGIVFTSAIVPGSEASLQVLASWEGRLDAWIDFGRDGGWSEVGDRIFANQPLSAGTNELTFSVPASAVLGESFARFRYSKAGVESYTGFATDGEVEDYQVVIEAWDWGDAPDAPNVPLVTPLSVPDIEDWQHFGASTATYGEWIFVGADFDGEGAFPPGAVYVYRDSASGWVLDQKLTPADPRDVYRFGASVSVWGDWAAVGTAGFVGVGSSDAAFLFQWDGTRWVEREKLTATDAGSDAAFGTCVELHDDLLLVGAPRAEVDSVSKGAVYVFRFDGVAWNREAKLTAGDASYGDRFGAAVAGRGDWVIAGAPNEDTRGEDAGAAYVFRRDGASWIEHQKIFGSEVGANDGFGGTQEIAFDGTRLLIGAPRQYLHASGVPGAAYVFEYDGSQWTETGRLTSASPEPGDRFGDSVALSGDLVLVAASGTGRVSLLRWDGETWEEHRTVTLPAEDLRRERAPAVSLLGNRAVVGDSGETRLGLMRAGGAYVYRFPVNPTNYPTLFVNNGARHTYVPDFYLGAGVDWEGNGLVHPMAEGDDRTGWDDEDGVSLSVLVPGRMVTAEVTASKEGYLNAWIDFNGDGDWDDDGEQIFAGQWLSAGVNVLEFPVPDWATPVLKDNPAFARFRFSSVQFLPYDGPAPDGEVEDYALEILEADGRITGRAFDDINLDRMPGPGEPGLDGWRIELIDPATRELIAVDTSRSMDRNGDGKIDPVTESGWYEFTGVPTGKFEIRQIPPLPSVPPADPGDQDPPDDPGGNLPGDTTVVELTTADLQGLAGSVRFPAPILVDIEAGDEWWTQMIVPGSDSLNGMQGTPAVPVFRRLIALPLGVEAKDVTVDLGQGPSVAGTFTGLHLYPFQPSPVDAVPDALYGDGSFVKDAAAYASQMPWPNELVRVTALSGLRGMNLALLEVAAAQYTPTDQRLVVFDRVDWSLGFPAPANQEERGFLTEREIGPFENASELHTTVLNAAAVLEGIVPDGGAASCFGVEYLILTHQDFREAADRLAEWKNAKGIGTKVHSVGMGTSLDTPEEIRDYIRAHYDNCTVRPSYVLLMGDTEFIPTWYVDYHSPSEKMDQSHAFGTWRSIGSYHFSGTPGEQITLTRQTHYRSDPADVGTVADAVRLVHVDTGTTITVDNLDSGFSTEGTWTESPAGNAFNGSALISTTDGDKAAWRVDLPGEGVYEVFVWYSGEPAAGSSGSYAFDSKARYTIVGATLGGDVPYALMDRPFDLLPDLAIGRIPVDTLAEAQAVVDKTIDYERWPPRDLSFYNNVSAVGLFQGFRSGEPLGRDQRSFIEESEHTRDTLLANGYQVQRIYAISDEDPGDGNDTPLRYYDGRDLPSALDDASGFAWNGGNRDIRNALLDGRFLVTYRAHGSAYGWAHPALQAPTGAVGLTPVVYSITCESGLFDNETSGSTRWSSGVYPGGVFFAESWLREPDRGAVGVIAATRVSPTWANSMLLRGLIDATWPDNDPFFGDGSSLRRLGDILRYGKQYMIANIGATYGDPRAEVSTSAALRNLYMYHVLGDPTLEMWIETPSHLRFEATIGFDFTAETSKNPPDPAIAPAAPTGMRVVYPVEDAEITAYQTFDGQWIPLGRGTIDQQHTFLTFVGDAIPDVPIQVVASLPGSISVPLITRQPWKSASGQHDPVPVEVIAPDQMVSVHFANYRPALVSGQIWEDRNGDGQPDADAPGMDGVTVELIDKDTGQVLTQAVSRSQDVNQDGIIEPAAESGWFSFPDLGQGVYQIRVVPPAGAESTWPTDQASHTFSVTVSGQTPLMIDFGLHWKDSDGDGVSDAIEEAAPFEGDGDRDGVPDRDQGHVVSLPSFTSGRHITLVAPETARFESVRTTRNPALADSPQAMMFEEGFLEFVLVDVPPGQAVEVVVLVDQWLPFNTYYQYGLLPERSEPTWYRFLYNGGTGAEILADRIVLHLTDGGRGDGDLTPDGRIVFVGAPAVNEHPKPWQNPKSAVDVTNDGLITPWDVLTLINDINSHGARVLPVPPVPPHLPTAYLDVSGDNLFTPLDVLAVINDLNNFGSRPVAEGESFLWPSTAPAVFGGERGDEVNRGLLAAWLPVAAASPSALSIPWSDQHRSLIDPDADLFGVSPVDQSSVMDAWRCNLADKIFRASAERSPIDLDRSFEDEDWLEDLLKLETGWLM